MKKITLIISILFAFALSFGQVVKQNTEFQRIAMFSGKPIVQDTSLWIKSGNDTIRITNYGDTSRFTTTAGGGWKFSPPLPTPSVSNIYNSDGTIPQNRTVALDSGFYAQFGDPVNGNGYIFGNLESLTGEPGNGFYSNWPFQTLEAQLAIYLRGQDEGLYMTSAGYDRAHPQGVIDLTKRGGTENIGAITVYDVDASIQRARVACSFDTVTRYSYARLCNFSAFDSTEKNYVTAYRDSVDMRYINSTTGVYSQLKLDDNGFSFNESYLPILKVTSIGLELNSEDSVTIYATTPANGTQIYCSNCTGDGITGRIVAYIGAAWRRLRFD